MRKEKADMNSSNDLAEILSVVSIILFVIAVVALIAAIILFIYFRIPRIYGDLSGKTARKSIKQMRQENESRQAQGHQPSAVNRERGEITQTSSNLADREQKNEVKTEHELNNRIYYEDSDVPKTGILASNKAGNITPDQNETSLLMGSEETTLLSCDGTALLDEKGNEKIIPAGKEGGISLRIIDEVMLIHTEEVI